MEESKKVASVVGLLSVKQRWSVRRKREVVLRSLRGESIAALSRRPGRK
jgi:hypothetical protein